MMAREIPGFFYDEAKGKYFRIQQNHRVVPGTGYTKQSVKQAQQNKQEAKRAQQQIRRQDLGKIVRSSLSVHTRSPLRARLGASIQRNRQETLKQYGAGLSRCVLIPCDAQRRSTVSSFSITRSGILRADFPANWHLNQRVLNLAKREYSLHNDKAIDPPPLRLQDSHELFGFDPYYNIESVYDSSGVERAVISWGSRPSCTIGHVEDDSLFATNGWIDLDLSSTEASTIWAIASAPNIPQAAVATDAGLMLVEYQSLGSVSIPPCPGLAKKEQMNVCWKDSNIVMSGERSGCVNFTDVRSGDSVVRLLHSSAVLGTLPLRNANQILAHGYSTTSAYDLRWVKQTTISRKARFTDSKQHSTPYLKYAVPRGRSSEWYSRGRKVAYSSDLDLIVAASSTSGIPTPHGYVTLYSASTGRVVDSPLTRHPFRDEVKSVDIRRVRDGAESIFCLSEDLEEWSCESLTSSELDFYGIGRTSSSDTTGTMVPEKLGFEQEWDIAKQRLGSR